MNSIIEEAYKILDGGEISKNLALELACLRGEEALDIISLANKVRNRFSPGWHVCTITNARSGACSQNCRYCAQSIHYPANVDIYPLNPVSEIVEEAERAVSGGATHFGIVTSGYGFTQADEDFIRILKAIEAIHDAFPGLQVCASLGILSRETARLLAGQGIAHYNHNIQVAPARYRELVATSHSVSERIRTVELVKEEGINVCSGAIIGLGESMTDRVELAYVLKGLEVDVIPLNVLIPIAGTPLENAAWVSPLEAAITFALFRLIHPAVPIKFAAGRETLMKDFQGLILLSGANGILTGGYLTTRGRDSAEDWRLISGLEGFQKKAEELSLSS